MKIKINGFENEIFFDNNSVNILTIKDTKCFTHLIKTINDKINGIETNEIFLLDEKNEEINMSKNAYMVIDVFNIEYNTKKILNKIYNIIADNIQNNQDYEVEKLALKLRNYIIQEINEIPFEFVMKEELEIQEILKLYNLKIDDKNYLSVLEKVELLIDLMATLKIANILIIPNLKVFLDERELLELYKYSLYNEINLLLIEKDERNILKYEKNILIDENFDDFILDNTI